MGGFPLLRLSRASAVLLLALAAGCGPTNPVTPIGTDAGALAPAEPATLSLCPPGSACASPVKARSRALQATAYRPHPVTLMQATAYRPHPVTLSGCDESGGAVALHVSSEPLHGGLSGQAPRLVYTPVPGYTGTDTFTFEAVNGDGESAAGTVSMMVAPLEGAAWAPPIGIPSPAFGIIETPPGYDPRNPLHYYVDNTAPGATDFANPRGSPALPRVTIPQVLPAGAYVDVHGGPYAYGPGYVPISGQGTPEQPIWVVGQGMPRFNSKMSVYHPTEESRYIVIQGLSLQKWEVVAPASQVVLRHCEVSGTPTSGGVTIASFLPERHCSNILVFGNRIHDNGDWQAAEDQDIHGIVITARVNTTWILDNEIFHNSGDGLQINAGNLADMPTTHHIYVGGNRAYRNKQAGLWSKQATDVIFSQNTCHSFRPIGEHPSAWGSAMGFQYGPERVWFLYNHVYDAGFGISSGNDSGLGNGQHCYLIGNVLHDIHHDPGYPYNPGTAWSNAAISMAGAASGYIIHNTIYDVDSGISSAGSGPLHLADNIVANITEPEGNHLFIEFAGAASASTLLSSIFEQKGSPVRIRWASLPMDLETFQARTGKGASIPGPELMPGGRSASNRIAEASLTASVCQLFEDLYGVRIAEAVDEDLGALEACQ